ncbi:MAG: periplasmic trypsin-like serine protease DegP [Acidobacteria bacterium]|nr:periplasmic trypsin-like serine protease DegP [Acidobacteriota bacterium]
MLPIYSIRFIRFLTCFSLLATAPLASGYDFQQATSEGSAPTLVRVNIIVETRGAKDTVEINGELVTDYSPTIIQDFPSTGIVLDSRDFILTFLGYRWVDIHDSDARIIITTGKGQKWKGKLVGIDQSNGVAVIKLLEGNLNKTPVCVRCEIKDGAIVMAPIMESPDNSEFREAQILSIGTGARSLAPAAWTMTLNRPFPDIGLPVLTPDYRVLGFIASQNPADRQIVVYPISQLLSSAEKILKAGEDIRTGWLGIFLDSSRHSKGPGVSILRVEQDSPAQKAGLAAGDLLLKFDGRELTDALQFVQLIQNTSIGSKVQLDVVRQGRPTKHTALIEARKPSQNRGRLSFNLAGTFDPTAKGIVPELTPLNPRLLMGLSTEMLTPPLADALQMPGRTGLLVLGVAPKLPADLAGVMIGDIIVSIDGQPILDPLGFTSFFLTHTWGPQSILKVIRKGTEHTIIVQLGD